MTDSLLQTDSRRLEVHCVHVIASEIPPVQCWSRSWSNCIHISAFFKLHNKLKPDWICIHALELHSQMHTEAFQEIRSHMCSTHDIKSVNEIRGGAWVEQRCSFRKSMSLLRSVWPTSSHLTASLHWNTTNLVLVSSVFFFFKPLINTHRLTCTLLQRTTDCIYTPAFIHFNIFITSKWEIPEFDSAYVCSGALLVLFHTSKTHTLHWDKLI